MKTVAVETDWAICGNRYETGVYTQEGKRYRKIR